MFPLLILRMSLIVPQHTKNESNLKSLQKLIFEFFSEFALVSSYIKPILPPTETSQLTFKANHLAGCYIAKTPSLNEFGY